MASKPSQPGEHVRLITQYQSALHSYIWGIMPNAHAVNDVLQETNLVLWQKAGDFEAGSNFKAWAFRIAYFQVLAYLKRELAASA